MKMNASRSPLQKGNLKLIRISLSSFRTKHIFHHRVYFNEFNSYVAFFPFGCVAIWYFFAAWSNSPAPKQLTIRSKEARFGPLPVKVPKNFYFRKILFPKILIAPKTSALKFQSIFLRKVFGAVIKREDNSEKRPLGKKIAEQGHSC